jgi:hypothetical protein
MPPTPEAGHQRRDIHPHIIEHHQRDHDPQHHARHEEQRADRGDAGMVGQQAMLVLRVSMPRQQDTSDQLFSVMELSVAFCPTAHS